MLLAGAGVIGAGALWKAVPDRDEGLTRDLAAILEAYQPYAKSKGEDYLSCTPRSVSREDLAALLMPIELGHFDNAINTSDRVREKISLDFKQGLTAEINGWILSKTEAALCTLTLVAA
jgi:hypothetical protein